MTEDISLHIRHAKEAKGDWTKAAVREALDRMIDAVPNLIIDWDTFAGEYWATAFQTSPERRVAALLCTVIPLAFLIHDYAETLAVALTSGPIELIVVEDIYDVVFHVDPAVLDSAFPYVRPDVDWTRFCAHDLFWATV